MSPRNTWLWVTLALGLFAFIFFVERHWRETETGPLRVLPGLNAAHVTSVAALIEVPSAGRLEMRAERTNGGWQLTRPLSYPAHAAAVEDLLRELEQLCAQARIDAAELRQRTNADEEFGFDVPQASLLLVQDGHRHQLLVGARTAPGDQVFLQVVGGQGLFVADAVLLKRLPTSANDWRDPALAPLERVSFDRVFVTNAGVAFAPHRAANEPWRLTHPLPARADATNVAAALQSLAGLRIARFVTDDPAAEPESFGFQPPGLALTFARGTNIALQLQFGRSPTNEADQIFARRLDGPAIVTVPREPLAPWRADFTSFRDRHLFGVSRPVAAVEVRHNESFTLERASNNGWRIQPLDLPADTNLVGELIVTLSGMTVVQFHDVVTKPGLAEYGLATPQRQFVVRAAPSPENASTNPVLVELHFGVKDDKTYARRTDEDSVYTVRTADVERLPTAAFQFRERRIWSFSEEQVAGVTIRQGGKTRQLLRQGTDAWTFAAGSQGVLNDAAIEETVHRLGGLSAAVWVAADAKDLTPWGFQPDSLHLTVELKSGEKLEVRFGGTAPSQFAYAATSLAGQTWVFECPPAIGELARAYLTIPATAP